MFWLILLIVSFVLGGFLTVLSMNDKDLLRGAITICIIGSIPFFISFGVGVSRYPELVGKRAQVMSLRSEIAEVRKSYYKEKLPDKALVGGSITNLSQSKMLSSYVITYATVKASYNKKLSYLKTIYFIKSYRWFGNTLFVSPKVLKLKLIP